MTFEIRRDLEPMSSEWLEALMVINTNQARLTMMVIANFGTTECCMICGDRSFSDVERPKQHSLILRLCGDCEKIQDEACCEGGKFEVERLMSDGFTLETSVENGRVVMSINGKVQARMTPAEARVVAKKIDDICMGKTSERFVDVNKILKELRFKVVKHENR